MASINRKLSGCYRRVLIFLIGVVALGLAVGGFAYYRLGGLEGMRHWMAGRALNSTETHLLTNRPDGISEEQIVREFQRVRTAISKRQADLPQLYETLSAYQTSFHKIKPSTPEIERFLAFLVQTILSGEP